jgi:hypothetical protein
MILDSRFWILDCGLKEHESHCRKRLRGERADRTGPPTLWYLGNVNGPQCHANQVVAATGLVDGSPDGLRGRDPELRDSSST